MRLKTTILLLSLSVWLPNQLNAQSDSLAQSETLRDTTVITYYPNGIPHKQTTYDEEGYVDGVYMQFRQTGSIQKMEHYRKGRLHGSFLKINNRGKIKEEGRYVNGKLDGQHQKYYYDGKKQEQSNYKDGLKNGKAIWYYTNGNMSTMLN